MGVPDSPSVRPAARAAVIWARIAVTLIVLLALAIGAQWLRPRPTAPPATGATLAEGQALAGGGAPVEGHPAPDFEMRYADGRRVRLSDLRGQPVIINFWASWCGPCRVEMPELIEAYTAHRAEGLEVIAVNVQEESAVAQAFAAEVGMPFTVVVDLAGDISRRYQVRNLPSSLFIDREGVVRARWMGILSREQLQKHLREIL